MLDLHEECFEAHVDLVGNKWGFSPRDWWEEYEDEKTGPVSDGQLDDLNFSAYYRCYPARDQDIAVIGTNPRFRPSGPGDEVFDFAEREGDLERIQEKSVSTMKNYFTDHSKHPRHNWLGVLASANDEPRDLGGVFRPLATETKYFDEEEYLDDDFYDDRFYDTVYYTNLFKFGSDDFDGLEDSDEAAELGEKYLKKELDRVDPNVVIMLGSNLTDLLGSGEITEIHGTHQGYEGYDVIPHVHPSGYRGSNASVEMYERYKETVKQLLG